MELQIWFWALAALLLAVSIYFLSKNSSRASSSSQSESTVEQEHQSSAPSSSNSIPPMEYEVFLSFRGPDVRTNFADCLYSFLDRFKIRTFIDDEGLRKGEEIAHSLVKAIEGSKVYVPILSGDYASSKWCLNELAHMVKCCKLGNGHILLPIFYMVDPRDVRHQEGSYRKAFRWHWWKYDAETIKGWKEALQEVGKMKGWHVTKSDGQGAVIDHVFSKIWSHLTKDYILVTDDLIGIGSHVERMKELLEFNYDGVKIVGILGMGGLGKTTIAKALYNEVYTQFDRCCFLDDVRETMLKMDGIVILQKKIISSILGTDTDVKDANHGINIIRNRVCRQRVLVILDDADDKFKFDRILGRLEDFDPGSRFIITTRDGRVMEFFQQYELYKPEELNEEHSLQLFSRHSLGVKYPPKEEVALSMKFVKVATGLPLALKVIGSQLFRKDKKFWEAKLKQLEDILPSEIQERLRTSYLELTHAEQQIFLDIACCFTGEEKEKPFYMWSDCGFHPEVAIATLIQMSLIKLNRRDHRNDIWIYGDYQENERNVFWMHDHIRDLGKTIIREEDLQCPWKRSRIWSNEDTLDMLTHEKGTERLEVLKVKIEDHTFELTEKQLEKLSGLRYLNVDGGRAISNYERLLPDIRWFQLFGCWSIPMNLDMKKLVILQMSHCPIGDWTGIKVANKLKSICIFDCIDLRTTPDLSLCEHLEVIDFRRCRKMRGTLHLENILNLKVLNLVGTDIGELTGDFEMLQNLQKINVVGSKLRKLPDGIGRSSSLEILNLQSHGLETEEVLAFPTGLKRLNVSYLRIPNLLELKNLEELSFEYCDSPDIPGDIWKLSMLKTLKLSTCSCTSLLVDESRNEMVALPSSLSKLEIDNCRSLERLPNLANLQNLTEFILTRTKVLEIPGLGEMRMLETLSVSDAPNLISLGGLDHLILLKTLHVQSCGVLQKLSNLSNLIKLDRVVITSCKLLSEIHGLGQLGESSLSHLEIQGCPSLVYTALELSVTIEPLLPFLSSLGKLETLILGLDENDDVHIASREQFLDLSGLRIVRKLSISGSKRLTEVRGLERLELLQSLRISNCSAVRNFSDLSGLKNLKQLEIVDCTQLPDELESLGSLEMSNCVPIKASSILSGLKHLLELYISGCTQMTKIVGLEGLESLRKLSISRCRSIKKLQSLSGLKHISELDIRECTQFTEVMELENLVSLKTLSISNCESLEKLPDLSCLKHLTELAISGCPQLTQVTGVEKLKQLTWLAIDESVKHSLATIIKKYPQ